MTVDALFNRPDGAQLVLRGQHALTRPNRDSEWEVAAVYAGSLGSRWDRFRAYAEAHGFVPGAAPAASPAGQVRGQLAGRNVHGAQLRRRHVLAEPVATPGGIVYRARLEHGGPLEEWSTADTLAEAVAAAVRQPVDLEAVQQLTARLEAKLAETGERQR